VRPNYTIVFINLKDDVDRRSKIESELIKINVKAERIDAVVWKSLTSADQEKYYSDSLNKRGYHSPLVDGEKGCYVSHIRLWERLLASGDSCMVVLEDDIQLMPDFSSVVKAISDLDKPWDMVKLIGRPQEKIRNKWPLFNKYKLFTYQRIPSYTSAYIVSRSGAMKLLQSRVPFGRPIDIDLRFWWENGLRIYGVWPYVVQLDSSSHVSSINGRKNNRSLGSRLRKIMMKIKLSTKNIYYQSKTIGKL
jgi:glycosyl transferase, family 25